jgi:ribosomal protein S18 acetylase RimI-like enzyme
MSETSAVEIRRATPADLPSLASLLYDSFTEYKSFYTDEGFAATTPSSDQLRQRMNEGPVWVATKEEAALGTVSAVDRGDYLYIRGMAVLPQARGTGLGVLLLRTVEEFAISQEYKRLTLSTTPFLDQAIRLYERSGFRRTMDAPHDLYGTPLFTMIKDLS